MASTMYTVTPNRSQLPQHNVSEVNAILLAAAAAAAQANRAPLQFASPLLDINGVQNALANRIGMFGRANVMNKNMWMNGMLGNPLSHALSPQLVRSLLVPSPVLPAANPSPSMMLLLAKIRMLENITKMCNGLECSAFNLSNPMTVPLQNVPLESYMMPGHYQLNHQKDNCPSNQPMVHKRCSKQSGRMENDCPSSLNLNRGVPERGEDLAWVYDWIPHPFLQPESEVGQELNLDL